MVIKEIETNKLELLCIDILSKAFLDLGQKDNDPQHKVLLAKSLAKDLMNRYSFFTLEAVQIAFDNGIRDTELFVLSSANWCKWLNKMKHDIWQGWYNLEHGNLHVIQPHIKKIMKQQKILIDNTNDKLLIKNG